jgi:hypothetical protein
MANHAILNNVEHRDLRVQTGYGAEFGDDQMCTLAIPSEFRNLVADYPIFLHWEAPQRKYLPMVMFGFQNGENLYLEGQRWQADYVPLMVRRGPFLIGFQGGEEGSGSERRMVISIDMDNPRVGRQGEPLFQPFGDSSDYVDGIAEVLQAIDQGQPVIDELSMVLEAHDLVEPFSLDVTLDNGERHRLEGFHTIHEEKLAALDGDTLARLSRQGLLHALYMLLASMANVPRLIRRKNQRSQA